MSETRAPHPAERMVSGSLMRLRGESPFFSVLSLFAEFRASEEVATAATDGKVILYNPGFLESLPRKQMDAVILHEVLHAALMHALRRGHRDPQRWNIAADIVVNGIIGQQKKWELPPDAIREPSLEDRSVEEIYELLQSRHSEHNLHCLISHAGSPPGSEGQRRQLELEEHWKRALRQAEVVARNTSQGKLPVGVERLLLQLGQGEIPWTSILWRFLIRTPSDFSGFDRRFLHQKLYLESLEADQLRVFVAIDTSGSIQGKQLTLFLNEIRSILGAYPHLQGELYYADAELYGPFSIEEETQRPRPVGGGGTSFCPFFERIERQHFAEGLCIYLTDGFGTFPPAPPSLPVLWVVTPGGLPAAQFPFGEVVFLLSDGP
ncbi:MAG: VWA-like domain-containing protein [Polyangiaceae bacterium]|jgi:predicted metal-dependent peptidase|nr:VWA-like domain-containing protein [Polyangiaceae bacterium]